MSYNNDEQARRAQAAQNAQWASNSRQPQNLTPYQTGTSSNPNEPTIYKTGTVPMTLLNSPSSHSIPGSPHNPAPLRIAYQNPNRQQDLRRAVLERETYNQAASSRRPPDVGYSAQPPNYYPQAPPNPGPGPSGSQTAQTNPSGPISDSEGKKTYNYNRKAYERRRDQRDSEEPTIDGPNPTFRLETIQLPPLTDEQILVKVLYISNDAGLRTFIGCTVDEDRMYVPPIKIGDPMHSGVIGEVLESNSAHFKPGDLVMEPYRSWWGDKIILDTDTVQHIAPLPNNLSITHYLGAFGGSGLAGYVGLLHIAQAKPEHTIVVSAAAGATGSIAVQTAVKLLGAKRVVGIAGGEEKCKWVRDYLSAHVCVDYKSPTFVQDLKEATPDEVDIYFDNVGGAVLDGVLPRMKKFGTIAVCGAVSTYNSDKPTMLKNWFEIISQRLTLKGFFLFDHMDKVPDGMEQLIKAAADGRINVDIENIVPEKIEDMPRAWIDVYNGGNKGKSITELI
ncbi:endo-polygalacturonase 6 [Fusarium acutatum]|uniref:Dehydrogenase FUB6 n=1 Tax=Fusarium acutatum TaxID=78861 RepID=A0A8H4JQ54_9HYPO|nr:endo-polygalacturonase 6 [Fusarium acutatum]